MIIPEYKDIVAAHERISQFIHKTPVLSSKYINEISGGQFFFKCENFQKVGAFKYRGATNAVLSLSAEEKEKGVATHSSGNHAQALALAAKTNNIKATIIMPENAPKVKIEGVRGYGADIIFCKPTLEARESTLFGFVKETGAVFIHPYDNVNVIAGQGTAAKELLEEIPDLDYLIAPIGGGGLMSGTCIAGKAINPAIEIVGAEPEGANDAYRSFTSGELIPSVSPRTIADGLLTSLSERTFSIIRNYVSNIVTVSDKEILAAMKMIYERLKIVIEPSSATVLAAGLKNKEKFPNKKAGLILSGGNVDSDKLFELFEPRD